jgi:glycosyltransferase involved in cell wall biosynthesis
MMEKESDKQMLTGRNILCFANDWAADPLSKKQVMIRLAQKHRILWVNSLHNRKPRFAKKDARRVLQKVKEFVRGIRSVHPNIWQVTPLYFPFLRYRVVRQFNRFLLRTQLRYAMWRLKFKNTITFTFSPTSADVVGTLGEDLIVYHCVDEYSSFSDAAFDEIELSEQRLLRKADLVLASSTPLLVKKSQFNPQTHLVLHGVDYQHFHQAVQETTPVASELVNLRRPILGFHGLLADWVDLQVISEIARKRPDWSVVLIGRADTDLAAIQKLPNVQLLGHRSYTQLPNYLKGFDVALLPFVQNELTRNANPLKLREYLAAGLPVVATPLPEVARFSTLVSLAATSEEYIHCIEELLAQGRIGPSVERSNEMASEAWERKVSEIEHLVSQSLSQKANSHGREVRRDRTLTQSEA